MLIKSCREELEKAVKDTRKLLEDNVALGLLRETERLDYAAQIEKIAKSIKTVLRFSEKISQLLDISQAINTNRQESINNARSNLLEEIGSENPAYARISSVLDKGDVLTANEYINMVQQGRQIPEPENTRDVFKDFFKDNYALLLLDEADKFLEADGKKRTADNDEKGDFIRSARLKGLMDRTNRRFKVVFAGLHNVQRTTKLENHPLAHLGEPICIGPLLNNGEMREARALIERPFASIGYRFESPDLVTRILSQTNYYPSLIQLYCQQLLRHITNPDVVNFDTLDSLPYTITSQQVDDAYNNQDLRKAIRDRFIWTLQLDQRYEVIAYAIAYVSTQSENGMVNGFNVSWIRNEVLTWWYEGFQGLSSDEIQVLLEEMVGLGVLRVSSTGGFTLRSPNVLLLMGTLEEIEATLLQRRELPIEYEPATFRSAIGIKDDS